jgi:hypothetical protein
MRGHFAQFRRLFFAYSVLLTTAPPALAGDWGCADFFAFPMIVVSEALPHSGVYEGSNTFATVEPGEPSKGGRMNKTCWARLKPKHDARIVLNTFNSAYDTALAVYTGAQIDDLTQVAFNDNFKAPGAGGTSSLVAFDAEAGEEYHIQIGSKTGATGDFFLNVFASPPAGGLSAYLAQLDFGSFQQPWYGADYDCALTGPGGTCPDAVFVLYNGAGQTLNVKSTSDLGTGITGPPNIVLPPGATAAARFRVTGAFDRTTTRTVSGHFKFTGRAGGTVISAATHPGLFVVNGSAGQPDVLKANVTPTVRAGLLNERLDFDLELTNTGAQAALGCHVRLADFLDHMRAAWRKQGESGPPSREPFSIGAGQKVKLDLAITPTEERIADPEFPLNLHFDCANTASAALNLSNAFDFTAFSMYRPAQLNVVQALPANDTLNVPRGGSADFWVTAVNKTRAADLRVIPLYLRPFEECCDPDLQFAVDICRTASVGGACLAPPSGSLEYTAAKNENATFRIRVSAPATNPGFDPTKRRVVAKFWQLKPEGGIFDAVVGAESVAVRRR